MRQLTDDAMSFAVAQFVAAAGHGGTTPTPCPDWTLHQLRNHTVNALGALADVLEGRDIDPDRTDPSRNADIDVTDHVGQMRAIDARLSAVAGDDAALDRVYALRGMEFPGRMVLHLALTDAAVHGWDASASLGETATIPPEVAGPLLGFARQFADGARGRAFGPEVPTSSDELSDQLVAFLGRNP